MAKLLFTSQLKIVSKFPTKNYLFMDLKKDCLLEAPIQKSALSACQKRAKMYF